MNKIFIISRFLKFLICFFLGSHCSYGRDLNRNKTLSYIAAIPNADWTIMIYMNGDNNLEGEALKNFKDIAKIGSTDKINIIVQFDRIGKYAHTKPDWSQTLRFRVTQNMEPLPSFAIQDIGEADMGDGKILSGFVDWAMKKYPAKHYMLDIWDHGQGYRLEFLASNFSQKNSNLVLHDSSKIYNEITRTRAITNQEMKGNQVYIGDPFRSSVNSPHRACSNDETNNDELYNRKIQNSLENLLNGKKIDVIGFDCCLMSMIETTYAMRHIAEYFVGSEELEPGPGWQYDDWLGQLVKNSPISALQLSKILVNSYKVRYDRIYGDPTTTMAAIDLAHMDSIVIKVTDFSNDLLKDLEKESSTIQKCRLDCSNFAPDYNFYHIDFIRFVGLIISRTKDPALKNSGQRLIGAITQDVVINYHGNERGASYGSNGLAIYFPSSGELYKSDPYAKNGYEKSNTYYPVEFVQKCRWSDFLHKYFLFFK